MNQAVDTLRALVFDRDWRTLIKPAIALAVLATSFLLGQRASNRYLLLAIMLVGGGVFTVLLIRRLEIGIAALIAASIYAKFEVGTGTAVSLNASLILSAVLIGYWLLEMFLIRQDVRLNGLRVHWAAFLMLIMMTISLAAGYIRYIPQAIVGAPPLAQVGGWAIYMLSFGMFLLVSHRVSSTRWLEILTWVFILAGGSYVAARLNPGWWLIRDRLFVHPFSFGSMFWTWLAALAFGQFLSNDQLDKRARVFLLGLLLALLYVNWTQTRDWISGWLPPAIAVGVILWLRSWRAGLAATIFVGIVYLITQDVFAAQVMDDYQIYSIESRGATLPIMFQIVQASPIIGLGFGNYYFYTPLFPIYGWYVNFNSHNNYVDLVAQTGLIGLGLFLWFVAELAWLGWRAHQRAPQGFKRGYIDACLGGLVAMCAAGLLGDWFLPFLYNVSFFGFRASIIGWVFLGGLALVANDVLSQPADDETGSALVHSQDGVR